MFFWREKEKADVDNIEQPSVRAFLKQQGNYEVKYNKEQQEYLEALNRQEVAEKVSQTLLGFPLISNASN